MRAREFAVEAINPATVKPGFKKEKWYQGRYLLRATAREPEAGEKDPTLGLIIKAYDPKTTSAVLSSGIAHARFIVSGDQMKVSWVYVSDEYQRQGIASAMYNFARELGNDIAPSRAQTDQGQAFWAAGAGVGRSTPDEPPPPEPAPVASAQPAKTSRMGAVKNFFNRILARPTVKDQKIFERQQMDSKEKIYTELQRAGYNLLGVGQDATVWAKDEQSVIKIIMPEGGEDLSGATETFYRFYEFCQQYQELECLPRFVNISAQHHHATFAVDGKQYMMVGMERLQPIPNGSIDEALVWIMSDLATQRLNWDQALEIMKRPETWSNWGEDGTASTESVMKFIGNMGRMSYGRYGLLFTVMVLLYHTGRINRQGWDLHTENVMQRANGTLVITDPWFTVRTGD